MTNNTIKLYLKRLKSFFDFENEKINFEKLEKKSKNYLSQCKNAIKHYYLSKGRYFHDDKLSEMFYNTNKSKKKKKDELQLKQMIYKINAIKNKKLKTFFKLQMISGLRVEEISKLDLKKDVEFIGNNRMVIFVHGKGEKERKIKTLPDKYVYENLKNIDKPYSNKTLMNKACKYNMSTHDFRRVFAQIIYYKTGDKDLVRRLLGHEKLKTTEIYLRREINFYGTKWDF